MSNTFTTEYALVEQSTTVDESSPYEHGRMTEGAGQGRNAWRRGGGVRGARCRERGFISSDAALVRTTPRAGDLFVIVFIGGDRIKILFWDRSGGRDASGTGRCPTHESSEPTDCSKPLVR